MSRRIPDQPHDNELVRTKGDWCCVRLLSMHRSTVSYSRSGWEMPEIVMYVNISVYAARSRHIKNNSPS
ncbi:MAG: hypothetical protein ACQERE_06595, partial [Pseudomonadota bacterium]